MYTRVGAPGGLRDTPRERDRDALKAGGLKESGSEQADGRTEDVSRKRDVNRQLTTN